MTKRTYCDPDRRGPCSDALAEARELALRTLHADQSKAPADVARHLEMLAGRLFEPCFDADELAADPEARRRFRLEIGVTAKAYRDQRLLEAANHLVCRSDLPLARIAAGLGFIEPAAFSRWFKYRMGAAPSKLRAAARAPAGKVTSVTPAGIDRADSETWSMRTLRRILIGDATPEQGQSLIRWLLAAYPEAAELSST